MANIRKILMRIAAENHTTVAEVRREISIAIEEGMKNPNPEIQKKMEKDVHNRRNPDSGRSNTFSKQRSKEKVKTAILL